MLVKAIRLVTNTLTLDQWQNVLDWYERHKGLWHIRLREWVCGYIFQLVYLLSHLYLLPIPTCTHLPSKFSYWPFLEWAYSLLRGELYLFKKEKLKSHYVRMWPYWEVESVSTSMKSFWIRVGPKYSLWRVTYEDQITWQTTSGWTAS